MKRETKTYKNPKSTNITSSKTLEAQDNSALSTEAWMDSLKNKSLSKSSIKELSNNYHPQTKRDSKRDSLKTNPKSWRKSTPKMS